MTISLDGLVADQNGNAGRLYPDLAARLVDELHVDIMPVFLSIGLRSFESSSLERVRLEKINVQEVGARTSLRFRINRQSTWWADFKECKRSVYRTRSH